MEPSTFDSASPISAPQRLRPRSRPLWPAYVAESASSIATTLLMVGIFFFTSARLGWGLRQNFLLAAGQGLVYVAGSLCATAIADRFGRRRGLIGIFTLLALAPMVPLATRQPAWLVAGLLLYTFLASLVWPALESLVASDADPHALSRRIGAYNLVWSGTNAVTFAVSGVIIARWPAGMFIIPIIVHAVSALLFWFTPEIDPRGRAGDAAAASEPAAAALPTTAEPRLLAQRTLALWLARISLPATYVVVYSLMAMMPSLPVMQSLDTAMQTVVGSVWMVARWLAFLALGATIWWHTRPMLLLAAAAVMLLAFIGITVRPSAVWQWPVSATIDLASMIAWQGVLGGVMGIIYAGSLYFGMVLSDGSTEHGGYHEALIGLGSVLGPGTAALTQWKWPNDVTAGVTAVSCIIGLSVIAAACAAVRARRREEPREGRREAPQKGQPPQPPPHPGV